MRQFIPHDWFVCPVTKQPLRLAGNVLRSQQGYEYHKDSKFGFWDFTPAGLETPDDDTWRTWQHLQRNGVASYENDTAHNLGVGKRKDYLEFAEFCNFHGTILDVGVGPQACPTHIASTEDGELQFVGIDPLVGTQPRAFAFVRGLGEYLPFRDGLFDQVLFVTTLDHFVDPRAALEEAGRTLKPDGEIVVWLGYKEQGAPAPVVSPAWYTDLRVPQGAEDIFHFKRLTPGDAEEFYFDSDLQVTEREARPIDQWRTNFFYRLNKR